MIFFEAEMTAPLPPLDLASLRTDIDVVAGEALSAARSGWPVDTGKSRDGWQTTSTPDGFVLTCTAPYAGYVNGGRSAKEAIARADRAIDVAVDELFSRILGGS